MPYKDPIKKAEYQRKYYSSWYKGNSEVQKKSTRERKRKIRAWYEEAKSNKNCLLCGISGKENPWVLEYHHRDSETKIREVSYMISNGYGKTKILEEIAKCDVVCANCHRGIHYLERQKNKSKSNT
tara:strand:+ start:4734 stop:5111 length:378 start_codon:yes stop_codon:yes gene_type:complete